MSAISKESCRQKNEDGVVVEGVGIDTCLTWIRTSSIVSIKLINISTNIIQIGSAGGGGIQYSRIYLDGC